MHLEEELEAARVVIEELESQVLELERGKEELRFSVEALEMEKVEGELKRGLREREWVERRERRERVDAVGMVWDEVGRREREELEGLGEERVMLGVMEGVLKGLEEGLRLRCVG